MIKFEISNRFGHDFACFWTIHAPSILHRLGVSRRGRLAVGGDHDDGIPVGGNDSRSAALVPIVKVGVIAVAAGLLLLLLPSASKVLLSPFECRK